MCLLLVLRQFRCKRPILLFPSASDRWLILSSFVTTRHRLNKLIFALAAPKVNLVFFLLARHISNKFDTLLLLRSSVDVSLIFKGKRLNEH